jgi:hypothetical protein
MFGHEHPDHQLLLIRQRHADLLRAAEECRAGHLWHRGEARGRRRRPLLRIRIRRRPHLVARRI